MLNFTNSITDIIATQEKTSRTSAFTEFGSKKKLFEAGVLNTEQVKHITDLKGACGFHLHKDNRYLIIVMWVAETKGYNFLVTDLTNMGCAAISSIKEAKRGVLDMIANEEVSGKNDQEVDET